MALLSFGPRWRAHGCGFLVPYGRPSVVRDQKRQEVLHSIDRW